MLPLHREEHYPVPCMWKMKGYVIVSVCDSHHEMPDLLLTVIVNIMQCIWHNYSQPGIQCPMLHYDRVCLLVMQASWILHGISVTRRCGCYAVKRVGLSAGCMKPRPNYYKVSEATK